MLLMELSGQAFLPSAKYVLTTMFHEMGQEYAPSGAQLTQSVSEPGVDHANRMAVTAALLG